MGRRLRAAPGSQAAAASRWPARIIAPAIAAALTATPIAAWPAEAGAQAPAPGGGEELGRAVPDVPATLPTPFAVMPFENRSGVSGLDWMSAGAAFLVGEKAEALGGLMPTYGPLVAPAGRPGPVNPASVATFAEAAGARYVWTGWIARPNWELQLAVALWEIKDGVARQVAEVEDTGEFAAIHAMIGRALALLAERAGLRPGAAERQALARVVAKDFYALTLFGRGLSATLGSEGAIDLERAQKNLARAVLIEPDMAEAHRVMAEVHRLQAAGKPPAIAGPLLKKADAKLSYALSVRPGYVAALAGAADLAIAEKKSARAGGFLTDLLRARPWQLEARFQLGRVLWDTGDADGAYRELERVVRHRPKDARARRILVLIHAARGDQRDLIRELEAVAALDPADQAIKMDLAAAYVAAGREVDAEAAYRAMIATDGRHVQALKFLADLLRRQGKTADAIDAYGRAIKAAPDDPRSYFLLGEMLIGAGDDKEARRVYQRAARFKRFLGESYNNLGAIALRSGDLGEALWYHKRAVQKKPGSARFRYNYALALSGAGKVGEALGEVDAGLAIEPNHVELHYLRGVVLLRQGDATGARGEFEKTLALSADHPGARHNLELLDELDRRAREGEVVVEGKE